MIIVIYVCTCTVHAHVHVHVVTCLAAANSWRLSAGYDSCRDHESRAPRRCQAVNFVFGLTSCYVGTGTVGLGGAAREKFVCGLSLA